jgi:hypothetical protein
VGLLNRLESDATVRIAVLRGEELIEVSLSADLPESAEDVR